jgi:hypothetical protein
MTKGEYLSTFRGISGLHVQFQADSQVLEPVDEGTTTVPNARSYLPSDMKLTPHKLFESSRTLLRESHI